MRVPPGFVLWYRPGVNSLCATPRSEKEGWLSPVEGTRLEIERTVKSSVGSNPTPSAVSVRPHDNFPRLDRMGGFL